MSSPKTSVLASIIASNMKAIVAAQIRAGVGPIDAGVTDAALLELAQLPHDKLRGLIVVAAVDTPDGLDMKLNVLGAPPLIEASMAFAELMIKEKWEELGYDPDACLGCGQAHDGPDNHDPLRRGRELHSLLEALLDLTPTRRSR